MTQATITLTFGDAAENHVGMQQLGSKSDKGFSLEDLENFAKSFPGCAVEKFKLNSKPEFPEAYFYIIRNGFKKDKELFEELKKLNWDTKALMKGKVVNKVARYNLCFDDVSQEPNYSEGKGRIVNKNEIPLLKELNDTINGLPNIGDLKIEGNYYYDVSQCYISEHGDTERRKVVGVRLGASMPITFRWYHKFLPVSETMGVYVNSGDIYFMSEKAVGTDWKKSSIYTLRHAAGNENVLNKNNKNK